MISTMDWPFSSFKPECMKFQMVRGGEMDGLSNISDTLAAILTVTEIRVLRLPTSVEPRNTDA